MITLTTGLPGAVKTLYAGACITAGGEREGRPVYYSGIADLRLPWIELEDATRWHELPANSILVIDEAQRIFRPRAPGARVPEYVEALETHRHKGIDLVLITQHPKLIDSNVRRLTGQHFHVVRIFGMQKATVHEWAEVKEDVESGSRSDSVKQLWAYPTDMFAAYKSAEVHTHKRRIPMRLFILIALPLVLAGVAWYVAHWISNRVVNPTKPDLPAGQIEAKGQHAPAGAPAGQTKRAVLTGEEYLEVHTPRVPGLAYTASVYDEVTKPIAAPYPAACVTLRGECRCYTDQATRLDVPGDLCRQIVAKGFYVDWDTQRGRTREARAAPPSAPPPIASAATVIPTHEIPAPEPSGGPAKPPNSGGAPSAKLYGPGTALDPHKGG